MPNAIVEKNYSNKPKEW